MKYKKKKNKINIFKNKYFILSTIFICIACISVGFSAFQQDLTISGEAFARAAGDIRITNIELLRTQGGATETAFPRYTKTTAKMFVDLLYDENHLYQNGIDDIDQPLVEYEITITNFSNVKYRLTNLSITNNNTALKINVGISERYKFKPGEVKKFKVTFMLPEGDIDSGVAQYNMDYTFEEVIPPNKFYEQILFNETGTTNVSTAKSNISSKGTPSFSSAATTDMGMYAMADNEGTSYYYRGKITDNYVKFGKNSSGNDLWWRIVRINGNNSVRLVYQGTSYNGNGIIGSGIFGYEFDSHRYARDMAYHYEITNTITKITDHYSSHIESALTNWYTTNISAKGLTPYLDTYVGYCNERRDDSNKVIDLDKYAVDFNYASKSRYDNNSPQLTCNTDSYFTTSSSNGTGNINAPIGSLSMEEVMLAGGTGSANSNYYLYTGTAFWTLTPRLHDYVFLGTNANKMFVVGSSGGLSAITTSDSDSYGYRPVINISADIYCGGGTGTYNDPYTLQYGADEDDQASVIADPTPYANKNYTLANTIKALVDSTEPADTTIVKHTSSVSNSANDNSYRYSGGEVNNYVCYGTNDLSTCLSNPKYQYRIIGVIDNKPKLVLADYATTDMLGTSGAYTGTVTASGTYLNVSSRSSLPAYAYNGTNVNNWGGTSSNPSVLADTNLNSTFYNLFTGNWKSSIVSSTWYVGDVNYFESIELNAQNVKNNELNTSTTYTGNIGLLYYHEYGFGMQYKHWGLSMNAYENYCSDNWLYLGNDEWTISHGSHTAAFGIITYTKYGAIFAYNGKPGYAEVNTGYPVRPTFSINSSVKYVSGTGSKTDPYLLNVS